MERENGYWQFIEKHIPDYYTNDLVLQSDMLSRYVYHEEVDEDDAKRIATEFKSKAEIYEEIANIESRLFSEAIEAYYRGIAEQDKFDSKMLISYLTPVSKIPMSDGYMDASNHADINNDIIFIEKEYDDMDSAVSEISHLKFEEGLSYIIEQEASSETTRVQYSVSKSDLTAAATLFNASKDNTNFFYELTGGMNDEIMNHFNGMFKEVVRKGEVKYDIATHDRMEYLKQQGIGLEFVRTAVPIANENLIRCGGLEMPKIVGGILKHFYYDNCGGYTTITDCIEYLTENDVAGYGFENLRDTYYSKVATFLYNTFTGLRLGSRWNGRAEVNGGYIVVKRDGDVVAFHSTIADEFKDFLVSKLILEAPSHKRHLDMVIEKDGDKYFLKLALQFRFALSRRK